MPDTQEMSTFQPVRIAPGAAATLVELARQIPLSGWDFPSWPEISLRETSGAGDLGGLLADINQRLMTDGFAVVRLDGIVVSQPEEIAASATTLLTSAFGSPLRIYGNNRAHWRALGARPERPLDKSEGIGDQPHHHDFCNAEYPPDVVCLLCLRPDPLGGGASIVAKMAGIEELLDERDVAALSEPIYRDGQVVNLTGVGRDANPFAVISPTPGARFRYRFVGHLLGSAPHPEAQAAVRALVQALGERTVTFSMAAGDLLLVNQHLAVHGKRALGAGQQNIPPANRRQMLLSFLRTEPCQAMPA